MCTEVPNILLKMICDRILRKLKSDLSDTKFGLLKDLGRTDAPFAPNGREHNKTFEVRSEQ